jgi:hypothetical protein
VSVTVTLGAEAGRLDRLIDALDGHAPVAVIAGDLVIPERALTPVTADPFAATTALVAPDPHGDVVIRHHRIISAGTSFHEVDGATHRSVGALVIAPGDAPRAREAIADLQVAMNDGSFSLSSEELVEAVLVALVRGQIQVRGVQVVDVPLVSLTLPIAQAACAEVATISEQRIAGLLANRVDDGFYSTFVVRKASKPLTRLALRLGLSPNAITMLSFFIGIAAAALFATGQWAWIAAGAVLLAVEFDR